MNVGYIRVSTSDQNVDRQKELLKQHDIEKFFIDKASGKDFNRPGFKAMNAFVRTGDTIIVSDWSRLGRSTIEVMSVIEDFNNKGINLISIKENIDSRTSQGRFILTIIAAFNEMDRELIKERQAEGIEIAKRKGVYTGRKKITKPKNFDMVYHEYKIKNITLKEALVRTGLKRSTFYKFLNESKKNKQDKMKG